ncbi:TIGR03016 family PEP-CTERM system-associated outer membrane protein [Thiohalorhabdus sp.]
MGPSPVWGGDWEITPRLRVAETFVDNVELESDGGETDYITEINPGLGIAGEGRRAQLDLQYGMQSLVFARDSDRNTINHQLGADGSLELVRRTLFLEADAQRRQQILDSQAGGSSNNRVIPANRADVTTFGGGPRLQYALGSFARARARYRAERVLYGNRFNDRTQQTVSASLASGARFDPVGWSLAYNRQEETVGQTTAATSRDQVLERVTGELNWRVGAKLQVFASGGYEDNQFRRARQGDPVDGSFWNAGLRWQPTRQTSLEASYGERFFGETWSATFRRQEGPHLDWDLSYSESLVTQTDLQVQRSQALVRGPGGNIILDPGGDPLTVTVPVATVVNEVSLQKRARGSVTAHTAKTRLTLSGFSEQRTFQIRDRTEDSYGGGLNLGWQAATRTNVSAGGRWQRRDFTGTSGEETRWSARASATRRVSSTLELSARYRHENRQSDGGAGRDYTLNEVTLALDKTF